MGTKQLLLITLGVIIVGLAVVVGIQFFKEGSRSQTTDQMLRLHNKIMDDAWVYFKTPKNQGGGGNNFKNFSPNQSYRSAFDVIGQFPTYKINSNRNRVLFTTQYNRKDKRIWMRSKQHKNGKRTITIRDHSSGDVKTIKYFVNQ